MTTLYDTTWQPISLPSAQSTQHTPSSASTTSPLTHPAHNTSFSLASVPITTGSGGHQRSPLSPKSKVRDCLTSSSRSPSPRSPSSSLAYTVTTPVVSVSDCSITASSVASSSSSKYWNGGLNGDCFTSIASSESMSAHRTRSLSPERLSDGGLKSVAAWESNMHESSKVNYSYLAAPTAVGALSHISPENNASSNIGFEAERNISSMEPLSNYLRQSGGRDGQDLISRTASLYSRRRTMLKAIREKSLSIDIDLITATATANTGV